MGIFLCINASRNLRKRIQELTQEPVTNYFFYINGSCLWATPHRGLGHGLDNLFFTPPGEFSASWIFFSFDVDRYTFDGGRSFFFFTPTPQSNQNSAVKKKLLPPWRPGSG
jgi:hypothetical protein